MKINIPLVSNQQDGFGVIAKEMAKSMRSFGHDIVHDIALDEKSDILLNFSHPHQFRYSEVTPVIGYMPWESTGARDGWNKHLSLVDDIWVTSPWLANVVRDWGYDPYIYEHGINPVFQPKRRNAEGKIVFLHIGMEALRKGALEAMRAFRLAFGDREDVELILKTKARSMPPMPYNNVTVIDAVLDFDELVNLYYNCDAFLFPSYGEGFGLPARDAAASGMPVIHTAGFAPYEKLINSDLIIPSELIDSPWPKVHPGKMYKPDIDSTVGILRNLVDNWDFYHDDAYNSAKLFHQRYDWNYQTGMALNRVADKFGIG